PVIQQNFTIICETVCRKRKTHSLSVGKATNKVFNLTFFKKVYGFSRQCLESSPADDETLLRL
ncbi:hypothetical protein, partial [Hominenteromicrobium sp.]|uniref:hypothetical protein n=1 Tax=Hominenteromicrobium sp. TaxID=3073581 RepID=UPI003A92A22B